MTPLRLHTLSRLRPRLSPSTLAARLAAQEHMTTAKAARIHAVSVAEVRREFVKLGYPERIWT